MWIFFSIPLIFIILGILIWAIASKPRVLEFGSHMVLAGLIGLCFSLGQHYFPKK